jgi:hypothetical protein
MRAALAATCTNETIKEICHSYEQSWSTPIGNKVIEFKLIAYNKLRRRILRDYLRGTCVVSASIGDYYETDKDMCRNH